MTKEERIINDYAEPVGQKPSDTLVDEKIVTRNAAVYLSSEMRNNTNNSLGVILTLIDAALGDTTQSKALKQSIKREMYTLMDRNQQQMYVTTGQQERVFSATTYFTESND